MAKKVKLKRFTKQNIESKPQDSFKTCRNYNEVRELAIRLACARKKLVPTVLPDEVLINQRDLEIRIDELLEEDEVKGCNPQPNKEHLARLTTENRLLKETLTKEKINNADLAGTLGNCQGLAHLIERSGQEKGNIAGPSRALLDVLIAWRSEIASKETLIAELQTNFV